MIDESMPIDSKNSTQGPPACYGVLLFSESWHPPLASRFVQPWKSKRGGAEMTFALVKINGSQPRSRGYTYSSTMMEIGASAECTNSFQSEIEMVTTVYGILAKQKRQDDLSSVLGKVRDGGYCFYDLDLTREEAESLGWEKKMRQ